MRSGTDQQMNQRAVSHLVATESTISGLSQDNSSQLLHHQNVADVDDEESVIQHKLTDKT